MKKHICKNPACGKTYEYCRGCLLSPISYKENGYCSETCPEAHKNLEEVVPFEDVEVVVIEGDTSTSKEDETEYPYFFTATAEDVIEEKEENDINDYEQNYGEDI